jgi:pimeloyl-ACP methyl ester carboxylesterase
MQAVGWKEPGEVEIGEVEIGQTRPRIAALEPLGDPHFGVGRDFANPSTTVLIAFAGMADKLAVPPFEFHPLTSGMPVKRLFVRDIHRAWYHRGVPEFGEHIEDVAASLRALLDEEGVEHVVVTGNSAGGYAALVFGALLEADTVLAFAPQTSLDRSWLTRIGDHRWDLYLDELERVGRVDDRYVDLDVALARDHNGATTFEVHYPTSDSADEHHSLRLDGVPGLELHPHSQGEHNLIKDLRDSGELQRIIRGSFAATNVG